MKAKITLSIVFFFSIFAVCGQTYQLTVNNGYGSGTYQSGDTVTVYCKELVNDETFADWSISAPVQNVTDDREWWFRFIMPANDVTVTANINPALLSGFLTFEQIRGRDTLKNVYHCLDFYNKGIVFFFHGGGGQASGLVGNENYDKFYIVKQLVQNNYGVIISECEERSINFDTDGSGNFTWQPQPYDALMNPDYANFIAITDTLKKRGLINPLTPWYGWGGSNGGSFSGNFSYFFDCRAAAIYIASSQAPLVSVSDVPFYFCVMPNDDRIGSSGNSQAFNNYNILLNRGICTKYFMNDQMPLYPEYFMRSDGITLLQSIDVYNDLQGNKCMDSKGYLTVSPDDIQSMVLANPSLWNSIVNLSNSKRSQVLSLLSVAYGGHEIFSNHCARTISFFDDLCTVTNIKDLVNERAISIYPNPVDHHFTISGLDNDFQGIIKLYNSSGQLVKSEQKSGSNFSIKTTNLSSGIYFIQIKNERGEITTQKFIKQ